MDGILGGKLCWRSRTAAIPHEWMISQFPIAFKRFINCGTGIGSVIPQRSNNRGAVPSRFLSLCLGYERNTLHPKERHNAVTERGLPNSGELTRTSSCGGRASPSQYDRISTTGRLDAEFTECVPKRRGRANGAVNSLN